MTDSKKNILILGTNDSNLAGQAGSVIKRVPESYNARLVIYESLYGKRDYVFHNNKSYIHKVYRKVRNIFFFVKQFCKYGEIVNRDPQKSEYCFYSFDDKCVSADEILAKVPGFNPDIISIMWVGSFVSPKTIYDLFKKTHAQIVIHFVDESPLAGGCHYHCDCDGFLHECINCPALKSGKELAHNQMLNRNKYLCDIPIILIGTPYDIEKAKKIPAYINAKFIEYIEFPKIEFAVSLEGRKKYGISEDEFVIFVGAANLNDVRKGLKYSIESIRKFGENKPNVTVIALGRKNFDVSALENVKLIQPGYLKLEAMMEALSMSDVFLSTTIADSGPYMVNYAFYLGVPVVSFDIGIAHTLIKDRVTGYFARYKDSNSLAEGLDYIYGLSPSDREIMSKAVKSEIEKYKNMPYWIERLDELK